MFPLFRKGADGARRCIPSVLAIQKNMRKYSLVRKVLYFAEGHTEMTAGCIRGVLMLNLREEMNLQK